MPKGDYFALHIYQKPSKQNEVISYFNASSFKIIALPCLLVNTGQNLKVFKINF